MLPKPNPAKTLIKKKVKAESDPEFSTGFGTKSATGKIDSSKLHRRREEEPEKEPTVEAPSVSAGTIDKVVDLAFNPSREKLPEVTIIDRMQGRLFPLLDTINVMWDDILQIAHYRQNKDEYQRVFKRNKPVSLNWLAELLYHTAQWQKSIGGANLTKLTDIALAEVETRTDEEGENTGGIDAWGKE